MSLNTVKVIAAAALIGALSSAPAFADGWGRGGGHFWGPAAAIGVIGVVVAGSALAAAQPVYPAGDGVYAEPAPTCYFARQPVVDGWGNLISYRRVRVCE
ncbi:MAG: hypothetical protein ABSD90_06020 [Methylocystis sp.]